MNNYPPIIEQMKRKIGEHAAENDARGRAQRDELRNIINSATDEERRLLKAWSLDEQALNLGMF